MVVPARAGMSPAEDLADITPIRGPRASGDEPAAPVNGDPMQEWSPRERG